MSPAPEKASGPVTAGPSHAGRALPWHRVLGAGGKISLEGAGGMEQRLRLAAEGVLVDAAGRVPLSRYQWQPRVAPF